MARKNDNLLASLIGLVAGLENNGQSGTASELASAIGIVMPNKKAKATRAKKNNLKSQKMTKKELETKVYTDISNDLITELERVIALGDNEAMKWVKTWSTAEPQNYITHKPYRGFNWLYLSMTGHTYLITSKQLYDWNMQHYGEDKTKWARKKEGAKPLSVVFYSPHIKKKDDKTEEQEKQEQEEREEQKERIYWTFKVYTVYDVKDIEGLPYPDETPKNNDAEIPIASALFRTWSEVVPIKYGHSEACYSPSFDEIHLPNKEDFTGIEEFYGTAGHECIHSTGASGRLNRKIQNEFGTKEYAKEELVAEIGGIKLANLFGFAPKIFKNTVAYLRSWVRVLKDNTKTLYYASSDADKAVEMIVKNYNERRHANEPMILLETPQAVQEIQETTELVPATEPTVEVEPVEVVKPKEKLVFNPKDQTVTIDSETYNNLIALVSLLG